MPEITDKDKLKSAVDMLYIGPQHFTDIKATECEIEIRQRLEMFKIWANKTIDDKVKDK